jgi:hypothetical protein
VPKTENKTIRVNEQSPLKWADGWDRVPIGDRKEMKAWKKPFTYYRDALVQQLERMGESPRRVRVKCENCGEFNTTQRYEPMGCPHCGFPVAVIHILSDAPPSQDRGAGKQAS